MKEKMKASTPAPMIPQSSGLTFFGSNPPCGAPYPPPGGGPHCPGGGGGGGLPPGGGGGGWEVLSLSSIASSLPCSQGKLASETMNRNNPAPIGPASRDE